MEEERARQAAAGGTSGAAAPSLPQVPESVEPTSQAAAQETVPSMEEDEEDALLAQALALSQEEQGDVAMESREGNDMDEDLNEEEEIARAIEMSVKEEEEQNKGK